ncbi:hypothetical protein N7510_011620 [Penicillium lagena]|uniref:uncharacterized protein n=1 Tax=Penicillium lagena TaxID=94218 RepID=UPI00253FE94F|nr:uncharacterized protein N7510_011620 [Penicillium lagena]KAJ5602086.1 hypothetical protein N7510_011620 [Penicillium lagena]
MHRSSWRHRFAQVGVPCHRLGQCGSTTVGTCRLDGISENKHGPALSSTTWPGTNSFQTISVSVRADQNADCSQKLRNSFDRHQVHLWPGAIRLIPSVLDPMTSSTLFTICMLILQTTAKPVFNYAGFTVDGISKDILQLIEAF